MRRALVLDQFFEACLLPWLQPFINFYKHNYTPRERYEIATHEWGHAIDEYGVYFSALHAAAVIMFLSSQRDLRRAVRIFLCNETGPRSNNSCCHVGTFKSLSFLVYAFCHFSNCLSRGLIQPDL
jgi:hypothetical protein